jgi:hypothetical protein
VSANEDKSKNASLVVPRFFGKKMKTDSCTLCVFYDALDELSSSNKTIFGREDGGRENKLACVSRTSSLDHRLHLSSYLRNGIFSRIWFPIPAK